MEDRVYLGVAVSIRGVVFAHPADGTPEAHEAARTRGDYPYVHLYNGDDVIAVVQELRDSEVEAA